MKRIFPFRIVFFFVFSFLFQTAFGAWINQIPQTLIQPDGSSIQCFATGDEFYNWLHDEDGYTIIQNHTSGWYYYAQLENEVLVPSAWKVGETDPATTGLLPWTNIHPDKMKTFRENFYATQMPARPAIPGYLSPKEVTNEGVLNNLVVYIRFSDQPEFTEDTLFYYNMFNNNNTGQNSMLNYFETVSYDMISIPSWFYPIPSGPTVISYQDIYPRSYFMPYDPVTNPNGYQSGQSGTREHALLKRACEFVEAEVPTGLIIDKDNDGYVDNMVFTVKGATTAWSTLLWPHRWALYNENVYIHGKRVWDYNLQVEDHLNGSGAGVLCHEMFHSLSAPDLYHYNSAPYTSVGPWDLMDNANNPPESMGAYMKYRYGGWIADIPEITQCGTYNLSPLTEAENNCFKIASPNSPSEYFVVEYRVAEGIFEGGLPGSGLLVYRIDGSLNGSGNAQGPPDEVYVYRPGGSTTTNGNLNQAHFAADYNRTAINDNTDPDPFLQNGSAGGLNIANVGYIGETISFEVFFETAPTAAFSASQQLVTPNCTIDFFDESVCEINSWAWTFEGGTPATSTSQFPEGVSWDTPGNWEVSLTVTNAWGSDTFTATNYIEVSSDATPTPEFFASDTVVCCSTQVSIQDFSGVCPDSWEWVLTPNSFGFVNGTSATSQNIDVILLEPVAYTVSLNVGNANGTASLTKEEYILAGGVDNFFEDFELDDPESNGWTIINDDNAITWDYYPVNGNGGEKAAGIKLFNYYSILKRDQLISPPIDLSSASQGILTFEHAYGQSWNTNYSDSLIVYISTDCGSSWTRILELGEDGTYNFATIEPFNYSFTPEVADDWCGGQYAPCQEVDISAFVGFANTKIMFESVRTTGNNMYIDNVGVDISTSLKEEGYKGNKGYRVYPNPASGMVNIAIDPGNHFDFVSVYNSLGTRVLTQKLDANNSIHSFDLTTQSGGIYFISLSSGSTTVFEKIVLR
ncbi:MAG: M6 family metalloprotease domain-containing protein [Bacteroidales bacterium]|nr:M6 family metalloprotease domain-containing protein [Bacteroidales bacterium]